MKPADRQKLVTTLQEKLVQLLGPLGIEVEHATGTDKRSVAEFTFRVRKPLADGTPRRDSELVIHLDAANAMQSHANPKHLEGLPVVWAGILADWVPDLFENAVLPSMTEIDWRPNEAVPEDFRAS